MLCCWPLLCIVYYEQANTDHACTCCRAAAAPFLGNFTVGSQNYKWLIFGDDDTVFLIDNVLKLVNEMDHKVPYFMTDHIWFPEREGTHCICMHVMRDTPYEDQAAFLPDHVCVPFGQHCCNWHLQLHVIVPSGLLAMPCYRCSFPLFHFNV